MEGSDGPFFGRRMCQYNCRIFDAYGLDVVSLAVLADDNANWRPTSFRRGLWCCSLQVTFEPVMLLDYREREAELEASDNPFAKVVLAHLKALETRKNPKSRREWKFRLVRGLYERGFSAEDVRHLFRLIDWLMELPPSLDRGFWHEIDDYQKGQKMPFLTTPERLAKDMAKESVLRLLASGLRSKFGEEGSTLLPEIQALNDEDRILIVSDALVNADSLEDVRAACAKASAPSRGRKKKS